MTDQKETETKDETPDEKPTNPYFGRKCFRTGK